MYKSLIKFLIALLVLSSKATFKKTNKKS